MSHSATMSVITVIAREFVIRTETETCRVSTSVWSSPTYSVDVSLNMTWSAISYSYELLFEEFLCTLCVLNQHVFTVLFKYISVQIQNGYFDSND